MTMREQFEKETGFAFNPDIQRGIVTERYVEWLEEKLRWIPVSERSIEKPKPASEDKPCLFIYESVNGWVIGVTDVFMGKIIYWMQLPPLPEE